MPDTLEPQRLVLQATLDAQKTPLERNQLGQFATPTALAREVAGFALRQLPATTPIRFLDPAIGTGSFYSAARQEVPADRWAWAQGVEIDPHYGQPAQQLWQGTTLQLTLGDFTTLPAPTREEDKATLLLSNPPYVRHHHLKAAEKTRLRASAEAIIGAAPQGTTGLYAYFLYLCHAWLAEGGIGAWLIPSEFMDVNYGRLMRQYLLEQVSVIRIHRYSPEDLQFDDALVSSAVVVLRKQVPTPDHTIEFSYGGSLSAPHSINTISVARLVQQNKWNIIFRDAAPAIVDPAIAKLSDFFAVKRGLATGCNEFFIMSPEQAEARGIPAQFLTPILPTARYLDTDEVPADRPLDYLLTCARPVQELAEQYHQFVQYIQEGIVQGIDKRHLCSHRTPWYSQEDRPPTPFLCTYMGRGVGNSPFRFILNHAQATASNAYLLLYPKPVLQAYIEQHPNALRRIWQILRAITPQAMIDEGRVYGGGLHKVEPKELASVPVPALARLLQPQPAQTELALA
jgi:adenine-specific DNA-methyltransferase